MSEVFPFVDGPLSLLSAADVGFAICRDEILSADRGFARILGRTVTELLGMTMQQITHPDDYPYPWVLDRARETGVPVDIRNRYLLPGGGVRWVENHIVPVAWGDGPPLFVVASRPVAEPVAAFASHRADMQDYVTDLTRELAGMASRAGLGLGGEVLTLAAHVLGATPAEGASPSL